MDHYACILKSPGAPDKVFTDDGILNEYLTHRWTSCHITGSELTFQRVLTDNTIVATIERVRLNPKDHPS